MCFVFWIEIGYSFRIVFPIGMIALKYRVQRVSLEKKTINVLSVPLVLAPKSAELNWPSTPRGFDRVLDSATVVTQTPFTCDDQIETAKKFRLGDN